MFQLSRPDKAMEEFYQHCTQFKVEFKVESLPNPSDFSLLRVMTIQSHNDDVIKVVREDGDHLLLPARGTVQVMLHQYELPPTFERIE